MRGEKIMSDNAEIRSMNEQLASQINREAHENPKSQFAGKYVGIANGKVVVVGDTLLEVDDRLDEIEPDASKCYVVDTISDFNTLQTIWGAN